MRVLPPIAGSEAWRRTAGRLEEAEMIERWPDDEETERKREEFETAVQECALKSLRFRRLRCTVPFGSTFFGMDLRLDRIRRSRKRAPQLYTEHREFFTDVQKERLSRSGVSRTGPYKKLFLFNIDDQKPESFCFAERNKRIQSLMLRVSSNLLATTTMAWRDYVQRKRRATALFARHVLGSERRVFVAWRRCVFLEKRSKRIRKRILLRLSRVYWDDWRLYTQQQANLRGILQAWRDEMLNGVAQRKKIANFMLRGSLDRIFLAWHQVARFEAKARIFSRRHFQGNLLCKCFLAWKKFRETMLHVKSAVRKLLGNCVSCHFVAWARYNNLAIRARVLVARSFRVQCRRLLRAWQEQARIDRLARLGLIDHCDDMIANFYKAVIPVVASSSSSETSSS